MHMENNELPDLSQEEVRVLGCLIEKSKTTPDYYPLTLKALVSACNQKSSRNPVVNYSEETVIQALDDLRKNKLAGTVIGGGSRVTKYKHNMQITFSLGNDDLAILCLLLLRGPLTGGEINSYSGRLYDFEGLDEVYELLQKLSEAEPAFVKQIGRRSGQKGNRFIHLFSDYVEEEQESSPTETESNLANRVEQLESDLAQLRQEFDDLMEELT